MPASLSLPTIASSAERAPSLAVATAWFDPLPPGPISKSVPSIVSPKIGSFEALMVMPTAKLPTTVILGLPSRPPNAAIDSHEDGLLVDLAGRKVAADPPVSHDQHPVGVRGQLGELRGDQDNCNALFSDAAQDRVNFRLRADIDAARRLVKD